MELALAERVKQIKPSPTLSLSAEVSRRREGGEDVISLEGGEPDFDTPDHVKQAALAAIKAGRNKYTAVDGTATLKQAIIHKLERDNGLRYAAAEVMVSVGAKQVLYNLCQAWLNPGDEVIIPGPFWPSYPDIVALAGGRPVIVPSTKAQGYKITASQLASAINAKTRLLILNSPCNPTGAVYDADELRALAHVLARHPQVLIASDDIYEQLVFADRRFVNVVNVDPRLRERTVIVNGVSKSFAMTGWRIGYAAGPAPLIAAMKNIQSQSTSNPTSIAQYAAEAALNGDRRFIDDMNRAYRQRHDWMLGALRTLPGVDCMPAAGAFYLFPEVATAMRALHCADDVAFARLLLERAGVAVVPGSAFGAPGHVRLSFAVDVPQLQRAIQRWRTFLGPVADVRPAGDRASCNTKEQRYAQLVS